MGGRNFCWTDHDGHIWRVLSVSYARRESSAPAGSGVLALCKCKDIYYTSCTKISDILMRFDPPRTAQVVEARFYREAVNVPSLGDVPKRCTGILQGMRSLSHAP
jgi:hypothetical protein